jgi:hypothetical protein
LKDGGSGGGIAGPTRAKRLAALFSLFYQVEIRYLPLLQKQSRTDKRVPMSREYNAIMAIA